MLAPSSPLPPFGSRRWFGAVGRAAEAPVPRPALGAVGRPRPGDAAGPRPPRAPAAADSPRAGPGAAVFILQTFLPALIPARPWPGRARRGSCSQAVLSAPGAQPGSVCRNGGGRGALCLLAAEFDVEPGGGGRASAARAAERGGPERRRSGSTWVRSGREAAARGDPFIRTVPCGGEGGRVGVEPSRGSPARRRRQSGLRAALGDAHRPQAQPCPRAGSRAAGPAVPGGRTGAAWRWRIARAAAGGCARSCPPVLYSWQNQTLNRVCNGLLTRSGLREEVLQTSK